MNFKKYGRTNIAEMAEYDGHALLGAQVSISTEDIKAGSPKAGDMIARNPSNHKDKWLVAKKYFITLWKYQKKLQNVHLLKL
jgi:hypothetical protein